MIEINNVVDSIINYNVYTHIISQNFGCFECKENLVSDIIREGFRAKHHEGSSGEKSQVYFEYGVIGLIKLLDEVRTNSPKNAKLLGSYYARIAELYIELNDVSKACDCLKNYKTLWPDAYNISKKKRSFYDNNCGK